MIIILLSSIGDFVIDLAKVNSRRDRLKHIGLFLAALAASADGAFTANKYMIWIGFVLALGTHMRKAFGRRQRLFRDAPALGVPIHTSEVVTKPHGPRDKE